MTKDELHSYYCDCEWCWLGVTNNPVKPPTFWQRTAAALRSLVEGGE